MLRITKLTDYAILLASALSRDAGASYPAASLAELSGLPEPTVRKVLRLLVGGGLVQSMRGSKGGYRLADLPENITVTQIVTAVEGPIAMTECCSPEPSCVQELGCSLRPNWQVINEAIAGALSSITLLQMNAPLAAGLVALNSGSATSARSPAAAHAGGVATAFAERRPASIKAAPSLPQTLV